MNNFSPSQEERHDLELVLMAGGLNALALGVVVFLSSRTTALALPLVETYTLIGLTVLMSGLGWVSARLGLPVYRVAWIVLSAYTLLITVAIHYTGGPQTALPGFYMLVVVAASFVLGPRAAYFFAAASMVSFGVLLTLEFAGVLPILPIWGHAPDPRAQGALLIVNWLTVAAPVMMTAFLGGSLAQRLKDRHQLLRATERLRQDLVAMLVHDLRNPLTVLLNTLGLMKRLIDPQLDDKQRRLLNNASQSGQTLVRLINEILDVAKLEAGQLQLQHQPLEVRELLLNAAEQARVLAEAQGIHLHVEAPTDLPPACGDHDLIQRVLTNLVSNALKYTPSGGSIVLIGQLRPKEGLTLSVRDTGTGIPPEQHARIFDKFVQVEQSGAPRRGTGLGLTFCKLAVEAHAGRIWVESAPGQGSVFTFSLPVVVAS